MSIRACTSEDLSQLDVYYRMDSVYSTTTHCLYCVAFQQPSDSESGRLHTRVSLFRSNRSTHEWLWRRRPLPINPTSQSETDKPWTPPVCTPGYLRTTILGFTR